MSFEFRPATRQDVPLLIGVAGPTGGGKTYSALRLAKGLAGDKPFAVIDTENGRALHYADEFNFDHGSLDAPFTPARYAEAIKAADEAGYPVIVVDSASHEHAGDGGLLDMHDDELQRMGGRESATMAAWITPKREHKRLVSRLLQINAHVILCLRAEAKVEIVKENNKTVIRPKQSLVGHDGWIPIAEKTLPFELTLSVLVTPDAPGVPKPIKLQQQHRLILPLNEPLSEEAGAALGAWAAGVKSDTELQITELSNELLTLSDKLERRDEFTDAIQKNRRRSGPSPAHIAWLEDKVKKARAAAEKLDGPEPEIAPPNPAEGLTGASDAPQTELSETQEAA